MLMTETKVTMDVTAHGRPMKASIAMPLIYWPREPGGSDGDYILTHDPDRWAALARAQQKQILLYSPASYARLLDSMPKSLQTSGIWWMVVPATSEPQGLQRVWRMVCRKLMHGLYRIVGWRP